LVHPAASATATARVIDLLAAGMESLPVSPVCTGVVGSGQFLAQLVELGAAHRIDEELRQLDARGVDGGGEAIDVDALHIAAGGGVGGVGGDGREVGIAGR